MAVITNTTAENQMFLSLRGYTPRINNGHNISTKKPTVITFVTGITKLGTSTVGVLPECIKMVSIRNYKMEITRGAQISHQIQSD